MKKFSLWNAEKPAALSLQQFFFLLTFKEVQYENISSGQSPEHRVHLALEFSAITVYLICLEVCSQGMYTKKLSNKVHTRNIVSMNVFFCHL